MSPVGNVFVTRDLDVCLFDPQINILPGLVVGHLFVNFDDPSCVGL